MATINNVACSWSMIELTSSSLTGSLNANPEILSGVTAIKWNKKWNIKTNYGLGGEAINRGFGNREYTASITMDYNTQMQLRELAGGGSLTDLGEFDLIISWANEFESDGWVTETVTLQGCIFDEDGLEASQDDTQITKEFALNPFKIVSSNS
jgi:hypothetical protein